MKKLLIAGIMGIMMFAGCGNSTMFDTTFTYDYAIIKLPNDKIVEGEVYQWCDYEGEQLQITFKNGSVYLVSSINAILMTQNDSVANLVTFPERTQ